VDPVLDILLDLDRLEMDRLASERAVNGLPALISTLENGLTAQRKAISSMRTRIDTLEQELYAASHQVIVRNSEINRLQESLASIVGNREYEALHASILQRQEQLGRLHQRQAQLRAELETLRESFAVSQRELAQNESDSAAKLAEARQQLAEYTQAKMERDAQIASRRALLPSVIGKEWVLLAEARHNRAGEGKPRPLVAPMGSADTHCRICFTELTRQLLRTLKDADAVVSCPVCGAFLVSQNPSEKRLA